jgi:hypothetical protein
MNFPLYHITISKLPCDGHFSDAVVEGKAFVESIGFVTKGFTDTHDVEVRASSFFVIEVGQVFETKLDYSFSKRFGLKLNSTIDSQSAKILGRIIWDDRSFLKCLSKEILRW